jgi:hypothetical protein
LDGWMVGIRALMVGVWTDRYDTKASGNWYKADEPWGAYLQTDGNPAVTVSPYESDPSSGSFNPQAHTTWVPVDWNSWPNCKCTPPHSFQKSSSYGVSTQL